MANRYYIPGRRTGLDIARLGLRLYSTTQRGKEAEARMQLSQKEHALAKRTEIRRERESRVQFGHEEPVTLEGPGGPMRGGVELGGRGPGRERQTTFIPGTVQRTLDEREALRNVNERTAKLTDRPPTRLQLSMIQNRIANFDKAYKGNTGKVLEPFTNFADQNIDSENPLSIYQMFGRLDAGIRADKVRITEELQKPIDALHPSDPKVPILAQRRADILSGKWLRDNMPVAADREMRERQAVQIEEDITKANLAKAERGPEGRAMKAWITPGNEVITIPNNQQPPLGSVPYQTGIEFESTPGGGVSLTTGILPGRRGQRDMTRGIQTKIEQKIINATNAIARQKEMTKTYRREFLEIPTRFKAFTTGWKEKLRGTPIARWVDLGVPSEDRKLLRDYSSWKRTSSENANLAIKEMTGVAMSAREADRLMQDQPKPGQGIFDGDPPTVFKSKLESTIKATNLILARYNYYLKNGVSATSMQAMAESDSLPSMKNFETIMDKRTGEILREIKQNNPNLSMEALQRAVAQRIKQEFGI